MAKLRVRIEVREFQEFDVDPEWFAGEVPNDPESLWAALKTLYTTDEGDPGIAWEAIEGGTASVILTRLDTQETATWESG